MPTSSNDRTAVANLTTDLFAPTAFDTLFLRPRFLVDEPAVAHVPLIFWACAALRPRNAAIVGVGGGGMHFALCQAMERTKGAVRCTGYGFWQDDASKTGEEPIPPELLRHQEMLYEDVSRLVACQDIDTLVDGLADASLDIVIIDLKAAPEGAVQRAEVLVPSLKDTGVLLIHGGADLVPGSADAAAMERFGKAHRSVHFAHDSGLSIVAPNKDIASQLDALLATSDDNSPPPEVARVFRRVGQGLLGTVRAGWEKAARVKAEERASEDCAAREVAEKMNESLNAAYDLRNRKIAEVQSELFDARLLVAELQAQASMLENEQAALRASAEKLDEEAADLRKRLEDDRKGAEQQRDLAQKDLKAEREARFTETAALTQMLETLKLEMAAQKSKHQTALASQREEHAKHDYIQSQLIAAREQQQRALSQVHRLRVYKRAKVKVEEDMRAVAESGLFDAEWYLATYSDVEESGTDPLRHFVLSGCYELRNPGPDFDSLKYHRTHADVTAAGIPALLHYVQNGKSENRQVFRVGAG